MYLIWNYKKCTNCYAYYLPGSWSDDEVMIHKIMIYNNNGFHMYKCITILPMLINNNSNIILIFVLFKKKYQVDNNKNMTVSLMNQSLNRTLDRLL